MMFKNTVKLVSANFYNYWKILLYKLIVLAICAGLSLIFLPTIIDCFSHAGLDVEIGTFFNNVTLAPNVVVALRYVLDIATALINSFVFMLSYNTFAFVFILFVIFILFPFLNNLSNIPLGECTYAYMSSLAKLSFTSSFIRKLGKSSIYSICKTFFDILINGAIIVGGYYVLRIVNINSVIGLMSPLFLIVYLVATISLKQTLLSGWMPSVIIFNDGVAKGFNQGIKATFRRFFRVLSTLAITNLLALCIIYVFNFYCLPLLVPFYSLFIVVFQMVMMFGSNGMRYYVDLDTILTPKKLETYDKIKKIKDLI